MYNKILHLRVLLLFSALLLMSISAGNICARATKAQASIKSLAGQNPIATYPQGVSPQLRSGDTCLVYHGGDIAFYIYPWVIGDELYKAYQDPSLSCEGPYPFTIENIIFILYFVDTATVYISVDVESADRSDPSCPRPDTVLAITPLYELKISEPDLYSITFPLDTPVVVNGPYFVGAYFADLGTPYSCGIVTDSIPAPCVSYNDWGEGYVDLDTVYNLSDPSNPLKVFPGRIALCSYGTAGGHSGEQPAPAARFILPAHNQLVGGEVELWADDGAGSEIISNALFQYYVDDTWINIGADADGDAPLRNGVTTSGGGDGFTRIWNTTGLSENNYQLRVILGDTLGRADTAEIDVYMDPTPPFPSFYQPEFGQNVCTGINAQILCGDEDITYVTFDTKNASRGFSLPVTVVDQTLGGDKDGDPEDGNPVSGGEYGPYCSGPAAAATAIKHWYDKGYNYLLTEGSSTLTDAQLMDRLFVSMHVEDNIGVRDGDFISGLRDYILTHGNQLDIRIDRNPTVAELRSWMEDFEYMVLVGISGNPGFWMTLTGANGLTDAKGNFKFQMADPIVVTIDSYDVKEEMDKVWTFYDNNWLEIDIIVGLVPFDWTVSRSAAALDATASDGWGFYWDTETLAEDSLYFLFATINDQDGNKGYASVLTQVDCTVNYISGDLDNDGEVTTADIVYFSQFLFANGPAPPAGHVVADVNCDGIVNLTDIVYLHKFLFLSGPSPCP
jgi:hypothetical protein